AATLRQRLSWLRGRESNPRPPGYEPDEIPLLHPAVDCGGYGETGGRQAATDREPRLRRTIAESGRAATGPRGTPMRSLAVPALLVVALASLASVRSAGADDA